MPDAAASTETNGNRLTWKDMAGILDKINKSLDEQNTRRVEMEQRITAKLDKLACVDDMREIRKDVDDLKKNVYGWNGLNSALAVAGSIIAGWLGTRQ